MKKKHNEEGNVSTLKQFCKRKRARSLWQAVRKKIKLEDEKRLFSTFKGWKSCRVSLFQRFHISNYLKVESTGFLCSLRRMNTKRTKMKLKAPRSLWESRLVGSFHISTSRMIHDLELIWMLKLSLLSLDLVRCFYIYEMKNECWPWWSVKFKSLQ